MTGTGLIVTAALVLGTSPQDSTREETARRAEQAGRVDVATERAEDVEVMRRILNRAVGLQNEPTSIAATFLGLYQSGGNLIYPSGPMNPSMGLPNNSPYGTTFNYPSSTNTIRLADPFDGVYLKGHGVVYTLKVKAGEQYAVQELRLQAGLSAGCSVCHKAAPVPVEKLEPVAPSKATVNEWDRTRNALRGVKEETAADPAPTVAPADICRPGKLTEVLMTALMKNGRHIRHLAGAEAVTLVVTLDGLYGPARVAAADPNQAVVEFLNQDLFNPATPAANTANRPPAPAPAAEAKPSVFTDDEAKQIALGDLHLKQGKPKEAAEAYRRATNRLTTKGLQVQTNTKSQDERISPAVHDLAEEVRRSVQEVQGKLARALLDMGDIDGARAALDAAKSISVKVTQASPESPKPLSVPAKLVLTVKKADLDRADKLTATEFRKLVAVETVGLPPADKAKK